MKKFAAILLALAMMLSMLAGCGGDKQEDANTDSGRVTLKIGVRENAHVKSWEDNSLTKWLEETCDVNLEFHPYPSETDAPTQFATTVAAKHKLPDMLWGIGLGLDATNKYGIDGYLTDLSPYLDDKEGASKIFWDRMEETFEQDEVNRIILKMTNPDDGKIYVMPSIETSLVDTMQFQMWINTEWLDALGLEKPTNNDELYTVLKAFMENDCNGNGDNTDEIPLMGYQKDSGPGSQVVSWLINLFLYYNGSHTMQDYNSDGKLEYTFIQDEYRDALRYVNKLYTEGLISKNIWTTSDKEMKSIITPNSGEAKCGIFAGHLSLHVNDDIELLSQYEPLKTWGCTAERDTTSIMQNTITTDCEHPDKAFEVMMAMYSKEGQLRIRYGEYGLNWIKADEGALSPYGLPAEYILLADPYGTTNSVMWSYVACTLNNYAEGETAQISMATNDWTKFKAEMHSQSRKFFDEAADENNPEIIVTGIYLTTKETEEIETERGNVSDLAKKAQTEFITGTGGRDINDDADWDAYVKQIEELGLANYIGMMQKVYDRQTKT